MHRPIDRRSLLAGSAALGALATLGLPALGAETLVATTFPGTFNDAHRAILVPYFKKRTGQDATLTIQLAVDAVNKLSAASGQPPFDVVILDEGPLLDAEKAGLLAEYPAAKSPNYADLLPSFQDRWGPKVTMQVIGIGYNPKRIKTPPKSWDDLWNPAYKGRVGLTALNSSLGMAFLVELARVRGGSEGDIEPAFRALRELLPNVGAISANLGAHASLFQQEQIDISPYNFNFVETLKGKGVDIEFVVPDSGPVGWRTSLHVVKNSRNADLAVQYIDSHLAPEVQTRLQHEPYWIIPTNRKVALQGPIQAKVARTAADLDKIRFQDWAKINEHRGEWIERFNREIRL